MIGIADAGVDHGLTAIIQSLNECFILQIYTKKRLLVNSMALFSEFEGTKSLKQHEFKTHLIELIEQRREKYWHSFQSYTYHSMLILMFCLSAWPGLSLTTVVKCCVFEFMRIKISTFAGM